MIEYEDRARLPLVMLPMPMRTAIIHRVQSEKIEDGGAAAIGRQTAIIHRATPDRIEGGGEAPIGRWTKVLAFTVGLAAAIGGYALVMPRAAAWRTWASAHLPPPASASVAVGNPAPLTATPSLGAANPDRVQAVDHPVEKVAAHKARHSKRRHPTKHRTASRH
jgi:hypothetical protein